MHDLVGRGLASVPSSPADVVASSKVELKGGVVISNVTEFVAQNVLFAPYKGNPDRLGT